MNFISVFALILALPGLVDCNHWPSQTLHSPHAPPLSTSAVSSATGIAANGASVPAPTSSSSGAVSAGALSANHTNHRNLIIAIIILSVLLGISLLIIMSLVLCPCLRRHRRSIGARDGAINIENSLPSQTLGKPGTESKALVADVPAGPPSDDRALTQAPDTPLAPSATAHVPSPRQVPHHEDGPLSPQLHQERDPSPIPPVPTTGRMGPSVSRMLAVSDVGYGEVSAESPPEAATEREFGTPDALSLVEFTPGQDESIHPEVAVRAVEGTLTKEAVTQMVPMKPQRDLVNEGYNPKLDEKRPETIEEYLRNYRILFVIDDSSSMRVHWKEARYALFEIADHALEFHSDAVDIRFFNSAHACNNVKGAHQVIDTFNNVSLQRGTPTGHVLKQILDQQIRRLDTACQHGSYRSEPPLDIIVITDGVPNPDSQPAPVIAEAAKQLRNRKHHPNSIGIQFVQIGNNPSAEPTLLSLIDGDYDMVDTISYSLYREQGGGKLTAEVLTRIVLGGIHPNLRAYWNQYRRRENQRNLQMIY